MGFTIFSSLFDLAIGKDNLLDNLYVNSSVNSTIEKINEEQKKNIFLTLEIFADEQYDYDQKIYVAKGNVKALVNGWTLRSDLLSYDKSTGILSAEGNIRFSKGGQYLRGKQFQYNLLRREGVIKNVYGILNIQNVLDDLKINTNSNRIVSKNILNNKVLNTYNDGIEFAFGNIKLPKNKITRSHKSIGEINNWRFKSDLITIQQNVWKSNRIIFTNDPFDPHQISFQGIDVIAEEDDNGKLIITSSKTNLLLGSRNKFFLGKRILGEKKNKKKIQLMYDGKDRDGLLLTRRSDHTKINNNLNLEFNPQFLISRALLAKTNSYYDNQNPNSKKINFLDLFGLDFKLNSRYKNWTFDSHNDLSTLNKTRIFKGLRHSSSLKRNFKMPLLDDSNFNVFTTYRSRAWNGTIGETEIKSAYGGFIEKTNFFKSGEVKNTLNIRFGTAKYKAEKFRTTEIISLWRSSIFASLDSEYEIWKINQKNLDQNKGMLLSPVLINPELILRTNINSAYFNYEDRSHQRFINISFGPEIRLGRLERNFLDYTKLSLMPGIKFKTGNSPFKFDNEIDLRTIKISFIQQIYGPLMIDIDSNVNIDNSSENYGEYFDTKLGLLWQKRAYDLGIYYHPDNDAGGIYFRINGFDFGKSVKAVF